MKITFKLMVNYYILLKTFQFLLFIFYQQETIFVMFITIKYSCLSDIINKTFFFQLYKFQKVISRKIKLLFFNLLQKFEIIIMQKFTK
jgi:hypothetical protein